MQSPIMHTTDLEYPSVEEQDIFICPDKLWHFI